MPAGSSHNILTMQDLFPLNIFNIPEWRLIDTVYCQFTVIDSKTGHWIHGLDSSVGKKQCASNTKFEYYFHPQFSY